MSSIHKHNTINEFEVVKAKIPRSLNGRLRQLVCMKHPDFQRGGLSYEIE